jgi:hypothetical protein
VNRQKNETLDLIKLFASYMAIFIHVTYPRWVNELTRCSTYIYLFHIAIASVFTRIYALFQLSTANSPVLKNLHPLLVCVASTALAFGINKLVDLVFFKKGKE